jgi:SAM-dependent methyltransferase
VTSTSEYAASAEYLHLLSAPMWDSLRPRLAAAISDVDPAAGPVLELGAGTGLSTDVLLDALTNDVLAVEPSAQLRGVLLARLADRGASGRVTVHPGSATDVPLPRRLAAVVGMHMVGHLTPDERQRLWAEVSSRLAPGGPLVLNVQPPETVAAVPLFPWFGVTIGGLTYEGRGEAQPAGPDSVRWRMSYRTRDGDTVLGEAAADYRWWVLSASGLAAELAAAGLDVAVDGDLVVARQPHASPAI